MIHTLSDILETAHRRFAGRTAVKWKEGTSIREKTYEDLWQDSRFIARRMHAKGFCKSRAVIIGSASYAWIAAYLGLTCSGCLAVPLDVSVPEEELTELIRRSGAEAVFADETLEGLSDSISQKCPGVREIFPLTSGTSKPILPDDDSAKSDAGQNIQEADFCFPVHTDCDEVCTMIYTSGTTGISKGVMLTHRNLADNVTSLPVSFAPGIVLLSVLPIHHAYCLTSDWLTGIYYGATICINDSLMHMARNMRRFEPDYMLMVPLMIETLAAKLSALPADTPKDQIREKIFGRNLKCIFSGGAHLDPHYIDVFRKYDILISEGYGMSECSPVISMNGITEDTIYPGTVGRPIGNAEIKTVNGEIWVKSTSVMKGYDRMPAETAETITEDGWLRTGDLGFIDSNGCLTVTGRVKNLIITSNGENISPEEIENHFSLEPMISEIIITGDKNGLAAHIYPDDETVRSKELQPAQVETSLQKLIDSYNRKQPTYRMITHLILRDHPFIKSSTKKIKRNMISL